MANLHYFNYYDTRTVSSLVKILFSFACWEQTELIVLLVYCLYGDTFIVLSKRQLVLIYVTGVHYRIIYRIIYCNSLKTISLNN